MAPKTPMARTQMDIDLPAPTSKFVLSSASTTHPSRISKPKAKPKPLPRGKSLRAQRLRKSKGAERAEEVRGRTEKKIEKSRGRGRRKGERNAVWEELNAKIKSSIGEAKVIPQRDEEREDKMKDGGEGEWIDEDGKMVDVEETAAGGQEAVQMEQNGQSMGLNEVDDGVS
ncbi:MAG: hypothetical protein Q9220_005318 [cf. Caloplaca sp. 1 TL-2023]